MSAPEAAAIAAMLAADTALPYALVPWTPPLRGHRASPALRRAVDALLDAGGGLLVAHLRPGLPVDGRAACRALLAALRGVDVAEVHAVACEDGVLVVARLVPSAVVVPADLQPVEGADLDDLVALAAARLAGAVSTAQLDAVDEDLAPDERVLVAAGAVSVERGALVPTVAGLVALGQEPARLLGGLVAHVRVDGAARVVSGSGVTLPGRVADALGVPDEAREAVVALVLRALVERAWFAHAQDEPIEVRRTGRRVEVAWPQGRGEDGVPNRTLRRLLRAVGALRSAAERPEQIAGALAECGGWWVGERRRGEDVVGEVVLPGARKQQDKVPRRRADRRERRATVAAPALPVDAAPVRETTRTVAPAPPSDREGAVLALLAERERVTTREVINTLGWSRSTTRDVLARMVASGQIVSVAASARSPFQAYGAAHR